MRPVSSHQTHAALVFEVLVNKGEYRIGPHEVCGDRHCGPRTGCGSSGALPFNLPSGNPHLHRRGRPLSLRRTGRLGGQFEVQCEVELQPPQTEATACLAPGWPCGMRSVASPCQAWSHQALTGVSETLGSWHGPHQITKTRMWARGNSYCKKAHTGAPQGSTQCSTTDEPSTPSY